MEKTAKPIKGRTTFRIAAVLFVLSAALELLGAGTPVPLAGGIRSGGVAVGYHLIYIGLYAALGIGLWRAAAWGYRLVFITTAVYTLDKIQFVLHRQVMIDSILRQLGGTVEIGQLIDPGMLAGITALAALLFAACWWGFAAYTYFRRAYFGIRSDQHAHTTPPLR